MDREVTALSHVDNGYDPATGQEAGLRLVVCAPHQKRSVASRSRAIQRSRAISNWSSVGRSRSDLSTKSGAPLAVALSIKDCAVAGNSTREMYLPMSARGSRRSGSESEAPVASNVVWAVW
jgi:hypothetical protein